MSGKPSPTDIIQTFQLQA